MSGTLFTDDAYVPPPRCGAPSPPEIGDHRCEGGVDHANRHWAIGPWDTDADTAAWFVRWRSEA